ncbi:MAG TPA: hypothetical protein VHC49_20035 [Mycobacteriales bacterium]|nr:hypothetical protein [Mycobacteriales bacterium]
MITEGDVVRFKIGLIGRASKKAIPAGTEGYVVDETDGTLTIDFQVDDAPDYTIAEQEQVEFVRKGQPIS